MPYKSRAQQRFFHHLVAQGKLAPQVADEFDKESKGDRLPQRVTRRAMGGEIPGGMVPLTAARGGEVCEACGAPVSLNEKSAGPMMKESYFDDDAKPSFANALKRSR